MLRHTLTLAAACICCCDIVLCAGLCRYVLIAYSTVGGTAGGDISYWTQGISPAQVAEETKQLQEAAAFLLATYPTKTFIFENWEGDWASRAGGYNGNQPATNLSLSSMTKWLAARQAGVTQVL
eukprot:COSAG05_NODE_552_length_8725_cov_166.636796_3_plen_124_part_00